MALIGPAWLAVCPLQDCRGSVASGLGFACLSVRVAGFTPAAPLLVLLDNVLVLFVDYVFVGAEAEVVVLEAVGARWE